MVPDSKSSKEIAMNLLTIYSNSYVAISDLEKSHPHIVLEDSLSEALQYLESKEEIHIERNPRIEEGQIRRDFRSDDIVYFNTFPGISRRSLLYKTGVEYGDYTINHILGCAHGCQYPCYAMQISRRYGRVSDYEDWMHPRIVNNSLDLLEKEIPKLNSKIHFVHLSFMTDPFMYDVVNSRPYSTIQDLTFEIIKKLNEEKIKVTVLTKGIYPDELSKTHFSKQNEYGITLVSLDTTFHNQYEPFSAHPEKRLQALKSLHESGLNTWVSLEPYPTPNIVIQDLNKLLEKVKFADKLIFGMWNYNPEVNGYETRKKFYTDCSDTVIEFCKANEIQLHIKDKTPRSQIETQQLFVDDE